MCLFNTMLQIVVDGKEMHRRQPKKYYFVLNKPTNYLCSSKAETKDGKRTKIVLDLFDDWMKKWKEDKSKVILSQTHLDKRCVRKVYLHDCSPSADWINNPGGFCSSRMMVKSKFSLFVTCLSCVRRLGTKSDASIDRFNEGRRK